MKHCHAIRTISVTTLAMIAILIAPILGLPYISPLVSDDVTCPYDHLLSWISVLMTKRSDERHSHFRTRLPDSLSKVPSIYTSDKKGQSRGGPGKKQCSWVEGKTVSKHIPRQPTFPRPGNRVHVRQHQVSLNPQP